MRMATTGRCDADRGELGVAGAQCGVGPLVLGAGVENLGAALEHDPGEPGPVLVVPVDDEGGKGVLAQVREALSGRRRPCASIFWPMVK